MLGNTKAKSQGLCKYCGKKLAANEMLEHLSECKNREIKVYDSKRKKEGFFDILITSKSNEDYWMIIEVSEKTMLKEIDTFLREIWVGNEDCLSEFKIENIKYKYLPSGRTLYVEPNQSMYHTVKNILEEEKTFDYTYAESKYTKIELNVFKYREGIRHEEEDIVLLSRNISPKMTCCKCRQNQAIWVDSEMYSLGYDAFWCEECREEIRKNAGIKEWELLDNLLPICNSPRMGIDDYEGSDFYADEFKTDLDRELVKENEPKKVKKDTIEKFKINQDDVYYAIDEWENNQIQFEDLEVERDLATLKEWEELYLEAEKIKRFKVWDYLCDFEIISLKRKGKEPIFYSILGEEGKEYGVDVYEGYDDFKTFMMDCYSEELNISKNYVKAFKRNLACRWGNLEELSQEQLEIIKKLESKYNGKKNWLYFLSFEEGYSPCNLERDEVIRMTKYLKDLGIILEKFIGKFMSNVDVDFDEIMCVEYIEEKDDWKLYKEKNPLEFYKLSKIKEEDRNKLNILTSTPKVDSILDIDIIPLRRVVNDKKYSKPLTPSIYGMVDVRTGNLISNKISDPNEDVEDLLAKEVIRFIDEIGRPREIRTSNMLIESKLYDMCDKLDIDLKLKKRSNVGKKFGEYIMYRKEIDTKLLN